MARSASFRTVIATTKAVTAPRSAGTSGAGARRAEERRAAAARAAASSERPQGERRPGWAGQHEEQVEQRAAASGGEDRPAVRHRRRPDGGIDVARTAVARRAARAPRRSRRRRASRSSAKAAASPATRLKRVAAERRQPGEAGVGDVERRRQVFEGDPGDRLAKPGEHLGLVALDVDLDEARQAVRGDQRVEGRDLHGLGGVPAHAGEARGPAHALGEAGGERGDGRVQPRDREPGRARARPRRRAAAA